MPNPEVDGVGAGGFAAKMIAAVVAAAVGTSVGVKAEKPFTGDLDFGKTGNPGLLSTFSSRNG